MRLAEKYRPQTLADVIGQPCIGKLKRFAKEPFATCWLFQGNPGTGKSATALALAAELGAVDAFSGLEVICTANMGKAEAEAAVKRLHLRCLAGQWNVLLLEELERLSPQCQVFLKVVLASENLPPRAIVIATSNDTALIDAALLERFGKPLRFDGWQTLADAGARRLAGIWRANRMERPCRRTPTIGAGTWTMRRSRSATVCGPRSTRSSMRYSICRNRREWPHETETQSEPAASGATAAVR